MKRKILQKRNLKEDSKRLMKNQFVLKVKAQRRCLIASLRCLIEKI